MKLRAPLWHSPILRSYVSKILAGLDMDYNPVVSALAPWVEPLTVPKLHSQLLSFDARLTLLHGGDLRQSSAYSP